MDINLNIAILSHMNDLSYDIYDNPAIAETRAKFVKSLIFHNEDTSIKVEKEYLDFMWEQAETRGGSDCAYDEWCVVKGYKLVK